MPATAATSCSAMGIWYQFALVAPSVAERRLPCMLCISRKATKMGRLAVALRSTHARRCRLCSTVRVWGEFVWPPTIGRLADVHLKQGFTHPAEGSSEGEGQSGGDCTGAVVRTDHAARSFQFGIFTTGGLLVCKNGLSPFARSAFADVPTGTPRSPLFGTAKFTQQTPPLTRNADAPNTRHRGRIGRRRAGAGPPGPAAARWASMLCLAGAKSLATRRTQSG